MLHQLNCSGIAHGSEMKITPSGILSLRRETLFCLQALLVLTVFGVAAGGVQAQMIVDGGTIEVHPSPEDSQALASFTFRNTGEVSVKIVKIETSCSCLSAVLDKQVYQPGESGQGSAEFKVASFVGRHEKSVQITTDHPTQPVWEIPFVLVVPVVIEIEPRTLQWWVGEEPEAKHCTVRMVGNAPMKITDVVSTRESVEFSWKEVEEGRVYEIEVKPTSTDAVLLGALKIETDSLIPKYQRQLAFFSVYRRQKAADANPAQP